MKNLSENLVNEFIEKIAQLQEYMGEYAVPSENTEALSYLVHAMFNIEQSKLYLERLRRECDENGIID